MSSKIEWTDETWNPVTGCNKVSRGCKNCYAEVMHKRLREMGQKKYQKPFLDGAVTHEESLLKPFSWKKPRMVFVNSMSDLFHEDVPFEFIDKVFAAMALTPQHTYQVLTKRPERMAKYFRMINEEKDMARWMTAAIEAFNMRWSETEVFDIMDYPLPNVWLGTSVENQGLANKRIPFLLQCPAAVRFLSCEPLVGPVTFRWARWVDVHEMNLIYGKANHLDGLRGIDWVIVGGESGSKAEPMHPDWVRSLRDQCQESKVAFFFKQWGAFKPYDGFPIPLGDISKVSYYTEDGMYKPVLKGTPASKLTSFPIACKVGKKASGNLLDGRTHLEIPTL